MTTHGPPPLLVVAFSAALLAGCVERDPLPPGAGKDPTPAEPLECGEDERWDVSLAACVPEHCGAGRYPVPKDPAKDRVYVDPAFEGGSLGTADNPYRDVLEAVSSAGPDTAVLLAAGVYEVQGFVELSAPGQELLGRCPELTVLRAAASPRLVRVGQTQRIRLAGVTLEGGAPNERPTPGEPLVELFNSSEVVISDVTVRGASHDGILVWQCEDVLVQRCLVEDSVRAGISMSLTSRGAVQDSHVRATAADQDGDLGVGIWVEHGVSLRVTRNLVEDGAGPGVIVTDAHGARVVDNRVEGNDGTGIWTEYDEDLWIDDNVVVDNRGLGVAFRASSGFVRDNHVADTRSGEDGHGGRGLDVRDAGPVAVERNVVERNREAGLLVRLTDGVVRDNEVRDNVASDAGHGGRGIEIRDVGAVEITGNLVERCEEAGIVLIDATGVVEGNEVRDIAAAQQAVDGYDFGHGIHVQSSTDVVSSNNVVVGSRHAGLLYLHTLRGEILDNVVEDTAGGPAPWDHGDGLVSADVDEQITLSGNEVRGSQRCGVLIDGGTIGWIEGNTITANGRAVVGQQGAVLQLDDNDIEGNVDDSVEQTPGPLLPMYEALLDPIDAD